MKKKLLFILPLAMTAGCYMLDETDLAEMTAKVEARNTGNKQCPEGFSGDNCDECARNYFGETCEPCTCQHGTCYDGIFGTGQCASCNGNWSGPNCEICTNGIGPECLVPNCVNGITDETTGNCTSCNDGWDIKSNCQNCLKGHIGPNCVKNNCKNGTIDETTGKCDSCNTGWDITKNCNDCDSDYYGENCENKCDCNSHGTCDSGTDGTGCQCANLWSGTYCNKCNDGYGNNCMEYGMVTDKQGNTYKTVIIDEREWMAQNSKYTAGINCYTDDSKEQFYEKYGCLYKWSDAQTVCPEGWQVPSPQTYDSLVKYINENNFLAFIAKSRDWVDYPNQGTDEFGFGALPAGYGTTNPSSFNKFGIGSYFWTNDGIQNNGTIFQIVPNFITAYAVMPLTNTYSVRCVKSSN